MIRLTRLIEEWEEAERPHRERLGTGGSVARYLEATEEAHAAYLDALSRYIAAIGTEDR